MAGADIEFRFDSTDGEERFLREYLIDAWERFEASAWFETGWFWRYDQFGGYESGSDGGLVRIVFEGDPDGLVDAEAERWEAFDGLDSWTLRRYGNAEHGDTDRSYDSLLEQQRAMKGTVGGEREYRLKPLAARFSLEYLREFDERLPVVADDSGENPADVGFWAHLHFAMIQCGYDWYDETDACLKGLKNRLKSLAAYRGADVAREEYDRIRTEWDAYEEDLDEWLEEHSTGEAEEP